MAMHIYFSKNGDDILTFTFECHLSKPFAYHASWVVGTRLVDHKGAEQAGRNMTMVLRRHLCFTDEFLVLFFSNPRWVSIIIMHVCTAQLVDR